MRKLKSLGIKSLVLDPTDLGISKIGAAKVTAVLALESMLKNLELKHADNADNNSFKTRIRLEEYLNRTVESVFISRGIYP